MSVALIAIMASCGETKMDPAVLEAKVNEAAAAKIEAATTAATTECETRMAADLKHTTDSMVHAMQMAAAAQ